MRLPDLVINTEDITLSKDEITANFDLWINATVRNQGVGTANNVEIGYWVLNQDEEYIKIGEETLNELSPGENKDISFSWTTEMTNTSLLEESRTIKVEINPDVSPLDDFDPSNNFATSSVVIKSPPNFEFTKDMQLLLDGTSYTEKTINEMDLLTIKTQIMNVGGTDVENASLSVSVNDENIKTEKTNLESTGVYNLSYDWNVNVTGSQTITVHVQSIKGDHRYTNQTSIDVEIQPAKIFINNIGLPKEPKTNEEVSISGVVVNDEGKTLEDVEINGYLVDNDGNKQSSTKTAVTNEDGYFMMTFQTPEEGGKYRLKIEPEVEGAEAVESDSFNVQGEEFPWWIVGVIVAVAIIGVVLVIVYFKFYGQGEIVECGNCGATIPADADKCPECGVEFDKDTVKCSECGEWIPADAEFCPECGAEFITTGEEVEEYAERMKNQYQKYKNKFRIKAEDEMERELTDEEFMDWWKDQPSYLTFDEWLEREEIKRKEGSVECPECGALNNVDAAVCQKCGSTLIEIEEDEEEEEEEFTEEMEEFTEKEEEELEKEAEGEKKEEQEPQKKIKKVRRVKKQPKKKRVKKNVIKEPSEKEEGEEETEEE
ncbi:MAG: CARDB domain-containing protein [Thermoplasmatota archaeon]